MYHDYIYTIELQCWWIGGLVNKASINWEADGVNEILSATEDEFSSWSLILQYTEGLCRLQIMK